MKKAYTLIALFFLFSVGFAQNEANNWYFGQNAGVTFNPGAPVALTNGQLNTLEGCSSISDPSGNLLFYTDGIKVWNRNHAVMANGSNLKGDPSSTQSGIIVPKPGSTTVYYIFTVDMQGGQALFAGGDADGVSNGFMYSEVDMTLNGGLGDVVVARKNVLLFKPCTEGISAVKHSNGIDYWVVAHGTNNNRYYSYAITAAGVNTVPIITNIGPNVAVSAGQAGAGAIGYMKISPNGKKIATCHAYENNQLVLSDFNAATGVLSNSITISIDYSSESDGPYGVEFSNCNEYLYVSEQLTSSDAFWGTAWPKETRIWRFDLNAGSIPASKSLFNLVANESIGALQLARDGKIYCARIVRIGNSAVNYGFGAGNSLHSINNPRLPGATFTNNAVGLAGRFSTYGLPPFVASFFYNSSITSTNLSTGDSTLFCFGDSVLFRGSTNAFDSVRWYFGDPVTGINNTSNLLNPKHLFSGGGTYTITFYRYMCGIRDSTFKTITVNNYPVHTPLVNRSICSPGSVVLDVTSVPVTSYLWSTGPVTPTITVSTAGKYVVTISNNGCKVKDSMTLTVNLPTTSTINQTICQGQSVTVGGQTFTTTQTNKIIVLANANSKGCDSTITLNLTVNLPTTSNINQTICQGQSVIVGGQTFTTTQINRIIVLANANSKGCDSTITLNLTVNQPTTSNITLSICQGQSVTVGGQTFSTSQVNKIIVLANANSKGCDSTITLNLTVSPSISANINQSICQGQSVTVGGQTFSTTQVNKIITLIGGSAQGCDSVITLNLTVNLPTTSNINQTICQGQSVTIGGQTFTTAQTNKIILLANANSLGCDSTITFNLTVNQPSTSTINQTICQGQSVTVGGQTFNTPQTNKIIVLANANSKGCDSIITFNLIVNQPTTSNINQTICQGQSVTVGGQTFTTPQTNKIIVLANANSLGCDSTITLNLIVNQPTTSNINQTICQGQSVTVGGQTFNTPQTNKIIVLANANSKGCDSTITLNLIVNQPTISTINQTICQGQSVTVGGQTFTTPQTNKIIVLANANSKGCDSTITFNLTVNQPTTSTINQTICQGQSVTVGGQTFNTPQTNRIIVLANANSKGCDSTITFNLIVNPKSTSNINQTICQGQSVTVGGQTFTTPQTNKIIVLANANSLGCDSTITLNLIVNQPTTSTINQTICQGQSVTVGGQTFNTPQTNKIIVLANANSKGCDSTITLNLIVNQPTTSNINQTICQGQSVTVGGQTFTTPQTNKIIVLANANSKGCDSIITFNLTVNQPTTSTVNQTICQGQSITVGGQIFSTPQINKIIVLANANSNGCDSVITLNLNISLTINSSITQSICQGQSITVGGQIFTTPQTNKIITLTNGSSMGCDSVITLNLTVNQPTTSAINQTICQGQSITVGGQSFSIAQTNKIIVLPNANSNGCDSTITLNLIVNPKSTSSINQTICFGQSVTVGGQIFTTTQSNKIITLANANSNGCDSTITLNLIVNQPTTSAINQTICQGQSVTVGGQTFTTTQTNKVIVLSNANSKGCDSVITLNLIVHPKSTSVINRSVCQGQSIIVGGQTFTTNQINKVIVLTNANSNGCDSTITLNLTVNPKSTSAINQSICEGQSFTAGGQTFTTTQTNKVIVLPNANSNGCDSTITLNLIVHPKSATAINQTICFGQSVTVGGQTFTTTQTNKIITLANANSKGCDSVITLNLTVNSAFTPSVSIVADKNDICPNDAMVFTATPANTGATPSYQWYINTTPVGTNSNQISISTLNNNDAVKVVITTTAVCANPKTVSSNIINAVVNKINYSKPKIEYCKGNSFDVNFDDSIKITPNPNFIISWTNGTQITTDSTSQYTINNSTSINIPFQIKYGSNYNCRVNDVLVVKVNPLPQIKAEADLPRVRYEDTVQLDASLLTTHSIISNYNWLPVNLVSNSTINNPTAQLTESTLFIVNVTDNNGCTDSDSVFVEVIDECTGDFIFAPSAFSPNNDGLNDCFKLLSPPKLSDFKMTLFNRWGEKVFETFDVKDCWDGTFKGINAMSDSYPYVISFKCYNGKIISKKGITSIIK